MRGSDAPPAMMSGVMVSCARLSGVRLSCVMSLFRMDINNEKICICRYFYLCKYAKNRGEILTKIVRFLLGHVENFTGH